MDAKQKIVDILRNSEEGLSDGYGFYCGIDNVEKTLASIAQVILDATAHADLLQACKAAETELKQMFKIAAMYGADAPFDPVLDKIRAAIAKAQGET